MTPRPRLYHRRPPDAPPIRPRCPRSTTAGRERSMAVAVAPRAAPRLVPVRQVRRRAEVRDAVAGRHRGDAVRPRSQRQLVDQRGRDGDRRSSAATLRARRRRAAALAFTWSKPLEALMMPLLVSLNMIPKVRARPADHRLVQVRHRAEHADRVLDLRLSDPADDGARAARGRARPARPGAHAARLALAGVHQDPAARRAAVHLLGHEGRARSSPSPARSSASSSAPTAASAI